LQLLGDFDRNFFWAKTFIDSAGELPQIVLVQKQLHFATSRPQGHQPQQIYSIVFMNEILTPVSKYVLHLFSFSS
jgi:hypothetical protein